LEFIETELGKSTWFAGDELTGAGSGFKMRLIVDIMMSFPMQMALVRADTHGLETTRMKDFLKRMEERPAYQRVVEKHGPIGI
jgi:glutathione S-transferase